MKNRQYRTEYHETTPSTKEITSQPPQLTQAKEKYKNHHDELQEHGYNRYGRGYEVHTPEIVYRVTGYRVKSVIGYINPGTNGVNDITNSVVYRVGLDIG